MSDTFLDDGVANRSTADHHEPSAADEEMVRRDLAPKPFRVRSRRTGEMQGLNYDNIGEMLSGWKVLSINDLYRREHCFVKPSASLLRIIRQWLGTQLQSRNVCFGR